MNHLKLTLTSSWGIILGMCLNLASAQEIHPKASFTDNVIKAIREELKLWDSLLDSESGMYTQGSLWFRDLIA